MNSTRYFLLALGLCVCLPVTVRAQPDPPPTPVERAQKLSEQRKFAEAQKLLEEQLAQNPPQDQRALLQNALADMHFSWGWYLREANTLDRDQAIVHYLAAYEADKVLRPDKSARDLVEVGGTYWDQERYEEAGKYWTMSVAVFHQIKDQAHEIENLNRVVVTNGRMGRVAETLPIYETLLSIQRERKDAKSEVWLLQRIGQINLQLKHYEEARAALNPAITIYHASGDKPGEVQALTALAKTYASQKSWDEALRFNKQALSLYRELKNRNLEGATLNSMGLICYTSHRYVDAANFYSQALSLYKELKRPRMQAAALNNSARAYQMQNRYEEALRLNNQALLLFRKFKNVHEEANVLNNIGYIYYKLSLFPDALNYYNQALPLHQKANNRGGVARILVDTGRIYRLQRQYEKALDLDNQALTLCRKIKQRDLEATSLNDIGLIYRGTKRYEEALQTLNEALSIRQELDNQWGMAGTLNNIGDVHHDLGHDEEALRFYKQALPVWQQLEIRSDEATTLHRISVIYQAQKQLELAILYDKQAVNLIQSVRSDNQNLDKESQRSFLNQKRDIYATLASLLVGQNRLEEAEQVLRFLRQEDAFEFVRREPQLAKELAGLFQPLTFTATERDQLPSSSSFPVTVGEGCEESRLWQQGLQKQEDAGRGRAALISTFNTADTFTLILTTAKERQAFSVPIKEAKFDILCLRLQGDLSDRTSDPRPNAQKMYEIVFANGKLESALQKAGITTALWFAAGSLRYIPIDALYDGKQYLVQKPRANVLVTLTSRTLFDDKTKGPALAAGVSQGHMMGANSNGVKGLSFPPLSNVPKEVRSIVRDTKDGGIGPFSGEILLNKQFTAANLERALGQGASVVHMATHFFLGDGSDSGAFLLLGDGKPLPISQWKKALKLKGVGLLTLSACETGVGSPDATGGEVSSIGEVSQWLGAQSVIVSLWPVADSSTGILMRGFYARWHGAPLGGKAQALRQAQRALMSSGLSAAPTQGNRGRPRLEDGSGDTASTSVTDPAHPYAHPYYWAPFSLIGNWK